MLAGARQEQSCLKVMKEVESIPLTHISFTFLYTDYTSIILHIGRYM